MKSRQRMRNFRRKIWILPLLFLLAACSRKMSLKDEFHYDPPGSFVTTDKPITPPVRSSAWLDGADIRLDTDFEGARINDATLDGDSLLDLTIAPERNPVNNSPWYAFRLISERERDLKVRLTYEDGKHRYVPKISDDGRTWKAIARSRMHPDTAAGTLDFQVELDHDTLWIAAQELINTDYIDDWIAVLEERSYVVREIFGRSRQDRPLTAVKIGEDPAAEKYVFIIGRQHPPEVTGSIALEAFVEAIAAQTPLAERFRRSFKTVAVPLMNPDGVDGGHWRNNAGGVDLNRDWHHFNQPETRRARDYFTQLAGGSGKGKGKGAYFAIDFHSTQEDIFYTLAKDIPTHPEGFTDAWLDDIKSKLPRYRVVEESFGLEAPISKNWFNRTFGCPAVTYEVGDEVDRDLIRKVSRQAARSMMRLLLEEQPS